MHECARDSRKIRDSWRAIGYLSKQWSGDPLRKGFLGLIKMSGVQWSGRRRAGNSCISRGPKSPLEKPDFSHLNNKHKVLRPQLLFFIYSLVIHTHPSSYETTLHHITASKLLPLTTLYHITVSRLLSLQYPYTIQYYSWVPGYPLAQIVPTSPTAVLLTIFDGVKLAFHVSWNIG